MSKKAVKQVLNIAKYKIQEPSKTLVDFKQFNGSLFNKVFSKYRTFMSLNKIEGANRDFKRSEFAELIKNTYNDMSIQYPKKDPKQMIQYLSGPLYESYKMAIKNKQQIKELEKNCIKTSIVQARVFNDKMATVFSSRVWYQITCQYNFEDGSKKYHIVEKKINEPFWRFCYLDQ